MERLLAAGIDEALAKHLAHLFSRDPLVVFEGLVEIDAIAQVLKDAGYTGFLAFETDMPHPDYAGREEEMVEKSIRYLKGMAASLR